MDKNEILEQHRELTRLKIEKLEKQKEMLPHLYGFPHYTWSRKFFEGRNPVANILCAGNQISKSSTQIRKAIHWATDVSLWKKLWPQHPTPRQFWYLYPSKDVSTAEFETKWEPEFLPRGEMKDHPQYGWKIHYEAKKVNYLEFNTGVRIYFKHYSQDVHRLQSGTVHAIFTDEELPVDLFDELNFRLSAVDGYFNMVFTATKGQEFWFQAIERIGQKDETLKGALKLQVSRYDCLEYEEGSRHIPTPWTIEKIKQAEAKCSTQNEIDKRINGRFVMDEGLKYPSFQKHINVVAPYFDVIEKENWLIYAAVDVGSGGKTGHPAAIVFLAVRPDFKKGAIFKGWKSPKGKDITSMDILEVFQQLKGKMKLVAQYYDWAASDFFQYASRLGEPFQKAEKGHEVGENTLNTLFKNRMLDIFDIEELEDLSWELSTLLDETPKRIAKDDFIDGARYVCAKIPWDWSACGSEFSEYKAPKKELSPEAIEIERRRGETFGVPEDEVDDIVEEIDYFNELMDV